MIHYTPSAGEGAAICRFIDLVTCSCHHVVMVLGACFRLAERMSCHRPICKLKSGSFDLQSTAGPGTHGFAHKISALACDSFVASLLIVELISWLPVFEQKPGLLRKLLATVEGNFEVLQRAECRYCSTKCRVSYHSTACSS